MVKSEKYTEHIGQNVTAYYRQPIKIWKKMGLASLSPYRTLCPGMKMKTESGGLSTLFPVFAESVFQHFPLEGSTWNVEYFGGFTAMPIRFLKDVEYHFSFQDFNRLV